MYPFLIRELYLYTLLQGTLDATTCTCIREKIDGITEKEIVTGHRSAIGNVFHLQTVRQGTRTVNFHSIIKDKDTYGSFPIQRTVNQCIYHKLHQTHVWNLKLTQ